MGLTKSLAATHRRNGVRADAVRPGGTGTTVDAGRTAHGPVALGPYSVSPGRAAQPEEPAPVIVFLASATAGDVNGALPPVDDGRPVA